MEIDNIKLKIMKKKEYTPPQIEINAIEAYYLLAESQITTPIGDGVVEPEDPNLSNFSTFQDDEESTNRSLWWYNT